MKASDIRVLVATEGPSEDVIADKVLRGRFGFADIDRKQFPARGYNVVLRAVPNLVHAAHFGYYGLLVVHFDLDDTHDIAAGRDITKCPRRKEVLTLIEAERKELRPILRTYDFRVVLMTGCESTDGWLCWGLDGGEGITWEKMSRRKSKERLYGAPPRRIVEQSAQYTDNLIARMGAEEAKMPLSLRQFVADVNAAVASIAVNL